MTESAREKHIYELIIDRQRHNWAERFITGTQIKTLAGVDQVTFDAWQDVPGPEDLLIADDAKIDLRPNKIEKFFTGKKTTTEG